jgi:two-component system response regulator
MNREQAILLVEDNDKDAELAMLSFADARISNRVVRAKDGVEALDYLFAKGGHSGRDPEDLPTVVLLDLNLPKIGGLEVLSEIRANERTKYLPVVVLTSSEEDQDRVTAYSRHVNSYVCKPVDYDNFAAATRELGLYWMVLNKPRLG